MSADVALTALYRELLGCWNKRSARDFAALFAEDGNIVGFDGSSTSGRAEIESHPDFPKRTNVAFIKPVDEHTLDVRFYERGAGETVSSGTGSTGAVAAAMARGMVSSPVRVLTPAGPLDLRVDRVIFLTGPADLIAVGEFMMRQ